MPSVGATSGMNTSRLSSPTIANPSPTENTALIRGTNVAPHRRNVTKRINTAESSPSASLRWVSGSASWRPMKPPMATVMPSGAAFTAASRISCATPASVANRSLTTTERMAVCPSSDSSDSRSAGPDTDVTSGMARSCSAMSSTDLAPAPPRSRSGSNRTSGMASAEEPGKARFRRSCATDESVPLRMKESFDSPPKARLAPIRTNATNSQTPMTFQPRSALCRPTR